MLVFLIILMVGFIGLSFLTIYKIYKLDTVRKIENKYISFIVSIIPLIVILIIMKLDLINSLIVLIFTLLIWYLCTFIVFIVKKVIKRNISNSITFGVSIIIAVIFLTKSYFLAINVVQTNYTIYTNKDIGVDNFRIVQISDSHIGATMNGDKFIEYMEKINETNPDIVVVTGDFIDDDTKEKDMIKGCIGLGKLKTKYGVYFIYGNHDKGYFTYRSYDDKLLREELKKNNVIILEDEIYAVTDNIYLIGRKDKSDNTRKSIYELINNIDENKYIIDLNHQPNDYKNEEKAGTDLVLSGHTHGGQFFPIGQISKLFGINDSYYGLQTKNSTNFIVNSGLGDWAIKFKTGTKSEYGVIDIKQK